MSDTAAYMLIDGIKCYNPEVAQSYGDYPEVGFDLTHENDGKNFWIQSRNRVLKALIRRYTRPEGKTSFLDVGCHTGNFLGELMSEKNLVLTGSEVYLKGLQYAKQHLPGVEFIQFDVTKNNFRQTFDMVGAFDVIEHIEDDEASVRTVHSLLNEDGYFIVAVPQYMFLWSRIDEIVKHKRRYTRKTLLPLLERNGFMICFCSSFLFTLFPLMLITRLLDKPNKKDVSDESEWQKRVEFPDWLNWIFNQCTRIDEMLIACGLSLPFGGTLLAVAQKKPRMAST